MNHIYFFGHTSDGREFGKDVRIGVTQNPLRRAADAGTGWVLLMTILVPHAANVSSRLVVQHWLAQARGFYRRFQYGIWIAQTLGLSYTINTEAIRASPGLYSRYKALLSSVVQPRSPRRQPLQYHLGPVNVQRTRWVQSSGEAQSLLEDVLSQSRKTENSIRHLREGRANTPR